MCVGEELEHKRTQREEKKGRKREKKAFLPPLCIFLRYLTYLWGIAIVLFDFDFDLLVLYEYVRL